MNIMYVSQIGHFTVLVYVNGDCLYGFTMLKTELSKSIVLKSVLNLRKVFFNSIH